MEATRFSVGLFLSAEAVARGGRLRSAPVTESLVVRAVEALRKIVSAVVTAALANQVKVTLVEQEFTLLE